LGLTQLRASLRRHRWIALDTSIFIYQLESNPSYVPLTDAIFQWLEQPEHSAVTSSVTMTELLVQPYRESGEQRVDEFYALLSTYPNLEWISPNLEIADIAARIRATHRLRTPDALQAATAVHARATALAPPAELLNRPNAPAPEDVQTPDRSDSAPALPLVPARTFASERPAPIVCKPNRDRKGVGASPILSRILTLTHPPAFG
jgi:predicted nucleic acid-binding protein